jgi:hypothetical protein
MLEMFDHFLSLDPPLRLVERFPNAINEIIDEITRDLKPEADALILDAVTGCVHRFSNEVADVENWSTTIDRLGDGIKVTVVTNERLSKLQEDLSRILLRYNAAMLRKLRARVRQMVERADLIEICAEKRCDVIDRQQVVERATEGVFELIGVRTPEAKAVFASTQHTLRENDRLHAAGSPDAMGRDGFWTVLAVLMAQERQERFQAFAEFEAQTETKLSLLWACYFGKEETVTELISSNKVAGTLDFQHASRVMSILMAASEKGRTGIVRELLAAGAKPELTNDNGLTALLLACGNAHMEAAAVLVTATKAAGAHDVVGCDDTSAIMWAEMRSWDGVARSLCRPALALFRGEAGAVQVLNTSYVGADRDARD